jgi:hypothetical protein
MRIGRRELSTRNLLAIGLFLLVILGILIDPQRWFGGIVWTIGSAVLMYRVGLWLAGPHLLPVPQNPESLGFARRMLTRFASGHKPLMAVVREGKVLPGPDGKSREHARGEGAVLVDSTSAVVLFTQTGLSRIKGPGIHFTRRGEWIEQAIDLRAQARSRDVEAQTRDGIWVKFKVNARFQIDEVKSQKVQDVDRRRIRWPEPLAWSPRQVMRAVRLERAGIDTFVHWDEIVPNEAVKHVHGHIANYTYDELTEPRNPLVNRREAIQKALEKEVKDAMLGSGINVLGVGLGPFAPRDKEVDDQRLENWQAEWIRRKSIVDADGLAESYRLIELARAQGQMETVTRIAQALEAAKQAGVEDAEALALHLLEVVQRMAAEPGMSERLSEMKEALDGAPNRPLLKGGT